MADEFKKHFDCVTVISLSDSRRRKWIDEHFGKLGIKFNYLQAVEGSPSITANLKDQNKIGYCDFWDREFTDNEIGCYFSHFLAWTSLLSMGYKRWLICEDDVQIDRPGLLLHQMELVPEDFEIVHFYSNYPVGSGRMNDGCRTRINEHVYEACDEHSCAMCYVVSAEGAKKLMSSAWPMREPADGHLRSLSTSDMVGASKAYIVKPFPVSTAFCGLVSEIGERDFTRRPEHIG